MSIHSICACVISSHMATAPARTAESVTNSVTGEAVLGELAQSLPTEFLYAALGVDSNVALATRLDTVIENWLKAKLKLDHRKRLKATYVTKLMQLWVAEDNPYTN